MRTAGSKSCFPAGVILFGSYIAIFFSPFMDYFNVWQGFQAWMIFPFFFFAFTSKALISIKPHEFFVIFIVIYAYISWFVFSIYYDYYVFSALALYTVSAICFFIGLKAFERSNYDFLDRLFIALALIIFSYGVFQYLSYYFNLGIIPESLYRGRPTASGKQITSIFYEPAFLGLFCISFLYYCLFVRNRLSLFLVIFGLVVVILSRSLSALVSSGVLVGCFFFLGTDVSVRKKIFGIALLIPALAFSITYFDIYDMIRLRFKREIFDSIKYLSPEYLGYVDNSGQARIIGELNYMLHVLTNSPFFGYGVEYNVVLSTYDAQREMALNGLVEIVIRWGLIGVGIFVLFIFFEKLIYKPRSYLVFCIFLALYLTSDGAISKIEFWLPIALVLGFERLRSNSIRNNDLVKW